MSNEEKSFPKISINWEEWANAKLTENVDK